MHCGIIQCQVQQAIRTDAYVLLSIMAIKRHSLDVTKMHPVNSSQPTLESVFKVKEAENVKN